MVYKNVLCLVIGLVIGIRLTDLWDYVRLQKTSDALGDATTNGDAYASSSNAINCLESAMAVVAGEAGGAGATVATAPTAYGDTPDDTRQQRPPPPIPTLSTLSQQQQQAYESRTLSDILYNKTRVLCWILTAPENHYHARNVLNTWGRRCNRLLFMSSSHDDNLGTTIKLNVSEGRNNLWKKTREAFKYVYEHHYNDYDWFLKADDDTYMIMENLRLFLYPYAASAPVYFGCKFNPFVEQGYMSGGAGYVLSREALRRFVEIGYNNVSLCSRNHLAEDKEMGVCMQNVGVVAGDSRDEEGQERFQALAPKHLIPIMMNGWYRQYLFYKPTKMAVNGLCCSHSAISFHYIKPKEFYMFEYLLYGLREFNARMPANERLPAKANMTALLAKWRRQKSNNVQPKRFG